MLEKTIEKKVIDYAKVKYKNYVVKLGVRGLPDRMFIKKDGDIFFIEFKSEKGVMSEQQKYIKDKLEKEYSKKVYVVNCVELGKSILDEENKG